ncbi:MAG: AAA family ATPase [Hormoscilla sp.]
MSTVADYQIVARIYESAKSLVYRAKDKTDDRTVILKVLKQDYPTPSELTRYKQEYEITRSINIEGAIAAYDLLPYENTLAIVLEDFGGQSLDIFLQSGSFTHLEFLEIAIQLAKALEEINGNNIIHKDINPANIILNTETGQVKIIDFGISSIFARENPIIKNPDVLEGTLAYISPEQTGRMNRAVDYRTDLYSLGATFYKLLTHQLLFDSKDPLELVHCHMAREPIAPHKIESSIPTAISKIVMKLLAKTAEERYQSASGLKADLENCYSQLKETGEIAEFPLARYDLVEQLQIPQKLYGRDLEIEQLLATFRRVTQPEIPQDETEATQNRVEMMLVGGYSGIGKTALIQELYKPLSQKRGYFIAGKFDQFQRNIPYSAIVSAFQSLVGQLLTESKAQLNQWRERLEKALGINGQVIVDVIPEIEQIIGSQPPIKPLEPSQAQNRFNQVFQNFIRVFCQKSHPIILFLDDLQWADFGTLKLIELMMTDSQIESLLLLGAYRDNEVDANHPTIVLIERLRKQGAIVNLISLMPLKSEDITQLLVETLDCGPETVISLTELIIQKTSGNPFFVNEFIKTIEQEKLLTFNSNSRGWEWDIAEIKALGITDNVVDLMIGKLRTLSEETQKTLRLSACIGNKFDLDTLSIIYEKSPPETFRDLLPAIQQGLVQPTSELQTTPEAPVDSTLVIQDYKFRHDRIQQAAYNLIDRDSRKTVHLQIGKLLQANLNKNEQQEKIFTLVDHFNKGLDLVEDKAEKIEILDINLYAGKKAKEAIAYTAARDYLMTAKNEFPGDIWTTCYKMAFELYKELAEIEYLNGNFLESQSLIKRAIEQAQSPLDSAEFYYLQIVQVTLQGQIKEAIELGRVALQTLGSNLPKDDLQTAFGEELMEYRQSIGNRSIEELYNSSEMQQLDKRAVLKILSRIFAATWILDSRLMCIVGSKMVNLSIKYGHTSISPMAYSFFGAINAYALKDYRAGYEFGSLGMKLSDKYQDLASKGLACQLHGNMTMPWLVHIKLSEKVNDEGVDVSLQVGDFQFVGYTLTYKLYSIIYQGINLEIILKEIERSLSFSQETQNSWATNCILAAKIIIKNLVGKSQDQFCFELEDVSESDFIETCERTKTMAALCFYEILKIQVLYIYEKPAKLTVLERTTKLCDYIPATISIAKHNFYYSLTLIYYYLEASLEERKCYWQQLETNQKDMKNWAEHCPENFLHKYLLVAAEMARISDKWPEAVELYDRAIESAKEHEFIQNEALGNELAAKFWLSRGKEDFAKLYMRKARQGYQIWGAKRKVEQLEEKYPQWFVSQSSGSQGTIGTTTGRATESLDIATVIQSSQTLAGEIVLKNLLGKLMEIAIANAGAEKGFLLLKRGEGWFIEAEGNVDNREGRILQSIPIETEAPDSALLPLGIINYVDRTKKDAILNDAANEGEYTRDPYIIVNKPKSILCTPLVNQNRVSGILYLENNLATNTFTRDRVELLQTLSTQAAISIENAQLYTQLEDYSHSLEVKVEERTAELAAATEEAQSANKAKSTFIANMSHELRSPLNAILGFSQLMLRSRGLSKEYAENLGIITRSGEHLLTLINNVLDLSKIESGKTTLNEKNFDLYRLLDDMEDMFGLKAKEKGLQLACDRSPEVPRYIRTDAVKLRQVIINLLNNALKFTKEGGVSVGATVAGIPPKPPLAKGGASKPPFLRGVWGDPTTGTGFDHIQDPGNERVAIHFEIADTGAGIAPEEIDSLFEAFVQTSTGKQAQEGTGLGLPISRQFVQLMGGDMGVRSQVGKGTVFYFDIEVPRVEGADIESNKPTRQIIALAPNQPRYRILIVDDKPINRKLLIELLNPLGFELKEANNGQEAVEIFSEWEPDLIWMDMRMPVMDGYEATRAIKASPKGETAKIIALTANVLEEEKAVVIEAGCDDFLRKPFRETEIFEMMNTHIGVSYVYEEERKTDEQQGISDEEVMTAEAISALPGELIASLEQALLEGDLDLMTTVTEDISSQNAPLAAALKTCLDNFEFDKVLSLL